VPGRFGIRGKFDNPCPTYAILTEVRESSSAPVLPLSRWAVRPGAGPEALADF